MAPFEIDDILVPVRAAAGSAQYGLNGDSIEQLLQEAGLSLEQAKAGSTH
jgi:predicted signal transduction protein with EAL and GGDEF domain